MSPLPTRRIFVYVAAGLVVLVVGTLGLVFTQGGPAAGDTRLIVQANGVDTGDSAAPTGSPGDSTAPTSSTTTTTAPRRIYVQVAGAVRRPGVYEVAGDSRAFQAILEAGGFTDDADEQAVALAASLSDGCRIYVPREGESAPSTVQSPSKSSAGITGGSASPVSSSGVVSLNSATVEELDSLPGIGPALAGQIIAYRETHGPFTSVDQLTDVPGIGQAKLDQLRPLVGL